MSGAVRLNRQLVLEQAQGVTDGAGGTSGGWTALGMLWGNLRPVTGRGTSGEDLALSRVSYRITVRAAPVGAPSRPRAGQRFRDGVRVFVIDAVSAAAAQDGFLICLAHEEVAR